MTPKAKRKDDYRTIAPVYDISTSWAMLPLRRKIARLILAMGMTGEDRVLELACGTGVLMSMLHERGVRTVGVDLSAAMLAKARDRGLGGCLLRADATLLPMRDGSFDCVSIVLALHENPMPVAEAMLCEALRVLRPGGRLILADWLVPRGLLGRVSHWAMHPVERAAGRAHYVGFRDFIRAGGLEAALARHGLVVEHLDRRFLGALGLAVARLP